VEGVGGVTNECPGWDGDGLSGWGYEWGCGWGWGRWGDGKCEARRRNDVRETRRVGHGDA
jgi:hypothetical protein